VVLRDPYPRPWGIHSQDHEEAIKPNSWGSHYTRDVISFLPGGGKILTDFLGGGNMKKTNCVCKKTQKNTIFQNQGKQMPTPLPPPNDVPAWSHSQVHEGAMHIIYIQDPVGVRAKILREHQDKAIISRVTCMPPRLWSDQQDTNICHCK